MPAINYLLSLLVPTLFILDPVWGASEGAGSENRRQQCLGRSVFETDTGIVWHLMDKRWTEIDDAGFTYYEPDIDYGRLDYGSDSVYPDYSLVSIQVSPKTIVEVFDELAAMYGPGEFRSKNRVVQGQIDAISAVLSEESLNADSVRYQTLREQLRLLNMTLKRISRIRTEMTIAEYSIKTDKKKNLPTEKLEAELKLYEAEYRTFPTDELYAREVEFDFGMPDAFGAHYHGQLVVLLWRNERIYKFTFGEPQRDRKDWSSFVDERVPVAHELLSRFRTREEFEIPQESGFCIPFGFIADDGRAPYSLHMAWHPVNNPTYLHSLKLDNSVLGGLDLLLIPTARVMSPGLPLGDLVKAFGPIPIDVGTRKGIMGGFYNRSSDPEVEPPVFTENYSIMGGQAAKGLEPSLVLEVETSGSQEPLPFDEAQEAFKTILKSFQVLPAFRKAAVPAHP